MARTNDPPALAAWERRQATGVATKTIGAGASSSEHRRRAD